MEAPVRSLLPLLLIVALYPDAALCQSSSPLARTDITASVGSFSAKRDEAAPYNRWTHSLFGGVGGGYYWSDHLKTEIEVASGGRAEAYGTEPAGMFESPLSSIFFEHTYRSVAVSVGQVYQFGRNALFHPFAAAGVDIERQHHQTDRPAQSIPVYTRHPLNPQTVQVTSQITIPALTRSETAVRVAPYTAAGFKAYFTERAFFRTDLKVSVRSGIDRVVWRAGFGADF
jgi:hypothetical protein